MKYTKAISAFVAVAALALVASPSFALAHGNNGQERKSDHEDNRAILNEFGVRTFANGHMEFPGLFYRGTVTAVSGSGFTLTTKDATVLTVTTASAKIVRVPHAVISLSSIAVGDTVFATGNVSGSTLDASAVFVVKDNQKPATAKGTVTAVSGNTVTLQTKKNQSVTVNTDSNTQVTKKNGATGTVATDVTVGTKVLLRGLWDSVTNIFTAIKIRIK